VAIDAARWTNKTEARALQAVPPATGTLIGHVTGRVIWDSPNVGGEEPQECVPPLACDGVGRPP
jgi:hypothetical protein